MDQETYKRTFSTLHTSKDYVTEVKNMNKIKKLYMKKMVAACAAIITVMGLGTIGYAANIGGIQRAIQIWMHGDQTTAQMQITDDGNMSSYTLTYKDENGNTKEMGGGGIAIDEDGTERPLTEEEIMEQLNSPEVIYEDDGTVWVYYYNQQMEITDKFDSDGFCYVKLNKDGKTCYLTVKYNDGYAFNTDKFNSPSDFR